jgi:hypothetical protein
MTKIAIVTKDGFAAGPLLVVAEQGLGDTIQFLRFIPELRKRHEMVLAVLNALEENACRRPGVAATLRQLGDVGRDAAGLVAGEAWPPLSVPAPARWCRGR